MRTTVTIPDDLLVEVKTYAARSGKTVNAVVEDALRAAMARRTEANYDRLRLPTFPGGRIVRGVDLDDSASLLEVMEDDDR